MTEEKIKEIEERLQKIERHKVEYKDLHSKITPLKKKIALLEAELELLRDPVDKIDATAEEEEENTLNLPIYALNLTNRSTSCLEYKRIKTIRDLMCYSSQDLLCIPLLGRKSLDEIKQALSFRGCLLRR